MKQINFRTWLLYILGVGVAGAITSPVVSWLFQEPIRDDLLLRSIFMGFFVGTGLYFWDNRKVAKKK